MKPSLLFSEFVGSTFLDYFEMFGIVFINPFKPNEISHSH